MLLLEHVSVLINFRIEIGTIKPHPRAGKITQRGRAPDSKTDHLASLPGTHRVEEENRLLQVVL